MNIGMTVPSNPKKLLTRYFYELETAELRRQGHKVRWLPLAYIGTALTKDSPRIKKLDFIVCHFLEMGINAAKLEKPFCAIYHGPNPLKERLAKKLETIDNCKFIGYEADYHRMMLENWGITKKPIKYVIPPVNVDLFTREKELGNRVLCGSRLIPVKGIDVAINAVNDIWVYGNGDPKYVEQLREISNKATFVGQLGHKQLKDFLEEGYLYLFPGISSPQVAGRTDGMPTAVQEAMAMELQVIASPVGAIPELPTVHLVEPDPKLIRKKMEEIPKERNIKGRNFIRKNFAPKIVIDKLIKDIEEVI
jgi:glycosyltransferase involved in cell wall biosynthesis